MRIMVVEDSIVEQKNLSHYLHEWGLNFIAIRDGAQAWRVLQEPDAPNLVLLDWMLPEIDGIELCRRIRTLGANGRYIYTVMLTAKNRKAHLLTAMAAGADDYLAKPVHPAELRARIMVGKRILELQESLRFAATHDFLTKLLNREESLAALKREMSRSDRDQKPVAVILADIDHFKTINDTLGHAAGDMVLKEVAHRLQADLRLYDLAGRYGGEEFLLILPNCPLNIAVRRADEIRGLISKDAVTTTFARIPVNISMGVTAREFKTPTTIESLLQQADVALYAAKNGGRNRVVAFRSATNSSLSLAALSKDSPAPKLLAKGRSSSVQ